MTPFCSGKRRPRPRIPLPSGCSASESSGGSSWPGTRLSGAARDTDSPSRFAPRHAVMGRRRENFRGFATAEFLPVGTQHRKPARGQGQRRCSCADDWGGLRGRTSPLQRGSDLPKQAHSYPRTVTTCTIRASTPRTATRNGSPLAAWTPKSCNVRHATKQLLLTDFLRDRACACMCVCTANNLDECYAKRQAPRLMP